MHCSKCWSTMGSLHNSIQVHKVFKYELLCVEKTTTTFSDLFSPIQKKLLGNTPYAAETIINILFLPNLHNDVAVNQLELRASCSFKIIILWRWSSGSIAI